MGRDRHHELPSQVVRTGQRLELEYFENEDYVALLDLALTELDEEKRAELYRRMQQLMLDSNAFVFIAHPAAAILYRDSIEPGMLPDGLPVYHEFRKAGT